MSGGIPIIIVVDYPNDINIIAPSYPIMTHYGLVILLWHIVYLIMSLPSLTISHISMVYGHPILMTILQGPVNPSYLVLCKPSLLYHIYIYPIIRS
jgi:hypothetical protein